MIDPYEGGSGKFDRDATKILQHPLLRRRDPGDRDQSLRKRLTTFSKLSDSNNNVLDESTSTSQLTFSHPYRIKKSTCTR